MLPSFSNSANVKRNERVLLLRAFTVSQRVLDTWRAANGSSRLGIYAHWPRPLLRMRRRTSSKRAHRLVAFACEADPAPGRQFTGDLSGRGDGVSLVLCPLRPASQSRPWAEAEPWTRLREIAGPGSRRRRTITAAAGTGSAYGRQTYALTVSLLVTACVFVDGLVSVRLPQSHLTCETQDVVKLGVGMLSMLASQVLGLLIATAKGSSDTTDRDVRSYAADVIVLAETLRDYGSDAGQRWLQDQGLNS